MAQLTPGETLVGLILMAGVYGGIFLVFGAIAELIERFIVKRRGK